VEPSPIAVAVRVEREPVDLTFWVRCRTSELDDDIDQAVFELDAFFLDPMSIRSSDPESRWELLIRRGWVRTVG